MDIYYKVHSMQRAGSVELNKAQQSISNMGRIDGVAWNAYQLVGIDQACDTLS